MENLWLAVALFLILEGIGPLLFPNKWQKYIQQLSAQSPSQLRQMGGIMILFGLILFYIIG